MGGQLLVEVFHVELVDMFADLLRYKNEKEFETVPVAMDRILAEPPLCSQIVVEEAVSKTCNGMIGVQDGSPFFKMF